MSSWKELIISTMIRCGGVLRHFRGLFTHFSSDSVRSAHRVAAPLFPAKSGLTAASSHICGNCAPRISTAIFGRLFSQSRDEYPLKSSASVPQQQPPAPPQVHWRENISAIRREKSRSSDDGSSRTRAGARNFDRPGRRERSLDRGGSGGGWNMPAGGAARQGAWRDWGGASRDRARPAMSADLVEYHKMRKSFPTPDFGFWGATARGTEFSFKDDGQTQTSGDDSGKASPSRQCFTYPWAELPKDETQGVNTWDFRPEYSPFKTRSARGDSDHGGKRRSRRGGGGGGRRSWGRS